jgi:uncharacterized peroxidase-related enzyme
MFIESRPPDDPGEAAGIYDADRATYGHLPNFTQAFSLRPEVYTAWRALNGAIKAGMDPRRYELASVAAARTMRCSYCMLAHGSVLAGAHMSAGDVQAIAEGDVSGLDPLEIAVMELAERIALDAADITQDDIDELSELGLPDDEVLDVVLAAAARCFFAKVLDGVGALADARFAEMEPGLRDALVVGRPIERS